MGAGYLPRVLSWGMGGLGATIMVRGFFSGEAVATDFRYRPVFLILASIGVFGLLIERSGLALSVFVSTLVASSALREVRWIEAIIFGVVMAAFSALVFVVGLKLPIPIWPR
jgi:putative tricarboxylic transport membrane protein